MLPVQDSLLFIYFFTSFHTSAPFIHTSLLISLLGYCALDLGFINILVKLLLLPGHELLYRFKILLTQYMEV